MKLFLLLPPLLLFTITRPLNEVIASLSPGITFRFATKEDLSQLASLDRKIWFEHFKPLFLEHHSSPLADNADVIIEHELANNALQFLQCIAQENGHHLLVACDHDTIVGFIEFHKEESVNYIALLLVAQEYRGKNIGKALIQASIDVCDDMQLCSLVVLDNNASARRFYASQGFIESVMPEWVRNKLPHGCEDYYLYCVLTVNR